MTALIVLLLREGRVVALIVLLLREGRVVALIVLLIREGSMAALIVLNTILRYELAMMARTCTNNLRVVLSS